MALVFYQQGVFSFSVCSGIQGGVRQLCHKLRSSFLTFFILVAVSDCLERLVVTLSGAQPLTPSSDLGRGSRKTSAFMQNLASVPEASCKCRAHPYGLSPRIFILGPGACAEHYLFHPLLSQSIVQNACLRIYSAKRTSMCYVKHTSHYF